MPIQNYIPFIFLGVVLLGGVFKWVIQMLQEQAAQKRAQEREERARLEALRTGRAANQGPAPIAADPAASSAQRRLQELAERRRRQLEELKAKQAASRAPEPSAVSRPVPATPIPQSAPKAPEPARATEQRRQEAARRLERQRAEANRRKEAERRAAAMEESSRRVAEEHARERARVEAARQANEIAAAAQPHTTQPVSVASRPTPLRFGKLRGADLRRAVILQELLSPPVSARESNREPGPNTGGSW